VSTEQKKKIGRNDPCPCGSGQKHKKCCLRGGNQSTNFDALVEGGRAARISVMREVVESTFLRCRQRADWHSAEFDAEKVQITFEEIVESAKEAIKSPNHSRQYWFVLIRRWANQLWEELQECTGKNIPTWENPVDRLAGKLVLQATDDSEPWEWVEIDGQIGISYEDLGLPELIAIAKVFSLAALMHDAESRYRFACKNFRVFSTGENDALASQDTESVRLYEERRVKFGTLSGSAGLWYDPKVTLRIQKDLCSWFGVRQIRDTTLWLKSSDPAAEIELNYMIGPAQNKNAETPDDIEFIPYDALIRDDELRPAFEAAYSQDAQVLVSFFYTVSRFIYSILRFPRLEYGEREMELRWVDEPVPFRQKVLHHWNDVANLGLLRSSRDAWKSALLDISNGISAECQSVLELDADQLECLIGEFTWTHGDSVYSDSPRLFIALSSNTLALDATWLIDFLRHALLQASVIGRDETKKLGDVTGPWFESQAMSFFARELSLSERDCVFQCDVKDKTGAEEIDIAFVVNRCLFVLDCKAMSKTSEYMIGHHSILRNRQTEQLRQLRKRNTARIRKIKAGLTADRIGPDDFDRTVGMVCTTDVEYLPLDEPDFWSGNSPLVGPPNELLETINAVARNTAGVGSP